ncbi:MAG: hypothetical protein NVV72_06265 [Asticcacaulis sp.]|nr:hypothetical protein [Asticcacaulis sp.]
MAQPWEAHALAESIAEQGRHLLRLHNNAAYQASRAVALVAIGCVLSGNVGDSFRRKGLKRLPKALRRCTQSDGSHMSRSPEQGLELLYDLLLLVDALSQRSQAVPDYVEEHIERLSRFVRTLSHPDGSLVSFQGRNRCSKTRSCRHCCIRIRKRALCRMCWSRRGITVCSADL